MDSRLMAGIGAGIDSGAYTDLNRLNQLKVGKERDSQANLRKVAQEFESLFLNEMMKAMRSANQVFADGNYMNSKDTQFYEGMYDQQLAVTLAKNQGVGLADVLVRQMSKMQQAERRPNPFAQVAATQKATWPEAGSTAKVSGENGPRDDSKLLNQRRLALPANLTDRLLAGLVPVSEGPAAAGQALSDADWLPAQVFPAPQSQPLQGDDPGRLAGRAIAQPPLAPGKSMFGSPEEFVATLMPMAEQAAQSLGIEPRYLVAQAALETGWGKSIIRQADGSSSYNLFGIKSLGGWDGQSARVLTTEYKGGQAVREAASFRAYESFEHSFQDYVSFLKGNARYQEALQQADNNPEGFVRELQQAGYATDPQYARKISQIARQMMTYQAVASADTERSEG